MKISDLQANSGGGRRIAGLDIIRSCAIFFVIAGHFFVLHTSFMTVGLESASIFIQAFFLQLFYSSVPLFLLLTGYLNANKTPDKTYYRGIWKVLAAYLFFAIATALFKRYMLHDDTPAWMLIYKIANYSIIPYAWYIAMWIGLFLVTPFLNILYKAITSRRQKQLLLLIVFAMSSLPNGMHNIIIPSYWMNCFPLLYYFTGCYIREYQPEIKKRYLLTAIFLCCMANVVFKLLYNHPRLHFGSGVHGVFGVILAISFFLLLYKTDIKQLWLKNIVAKISLLSLDMFLCSYIFDCIYYPIFKERWFVNQSQFGIFFFVIVPLVFVSSLIFAQLKEWLFKICRADRLLHR